MNSKCLVFIPAGRWQLKSMKRAKELGFQIIGFDENPKAEGVEICDFFFCMKPLEIEGVIEKIDSTNLHITGAISVASEVGVLMCSKIRKHYNLPGLQPEKAQVFVEKNLQREIWQKCKVPIPKWILLDKGIVPKRALEKFNFPVIVKPTDSSGSRGISVIHAQDELSEALGYALKYSKEKKVILEEYLEGTEFTVEVFATKFKIEVLMITEKLKVPGTNNTVASQLFTPNLETSVERLIVSTTKKAFQSLGLEYGPGHAEVILKKDGSIGVVEVAARGGGFFIFDEMIFRASGFDVIENTIKTESGLHKKEYRRPINKRAVILDFIPTIEGKVKSIDVDYSWMQNNDVLFSLFIRIGDQLTTPKTDGDRICAFLVCGDTLEDARRRLMRAKDKVKIEIE